MLSSEILRWIQGLDLAYSVQNLKHDFSNGFLVAEIFSRYYERDVSMHSFSNGMNTTMRADNWRQLLTLFEKLGFEFDNKLAIVQNIMTHTDGPGSAKGPTANREETRGISYLLERIYEFLTHRKICSRVHEKGANKVKLKPKARSVDTKRSNGTAAESVLEEYKVDPAPSKREEQAHEYSSSSRTPRVMKGETRTVEKADSVQQIVVQKIDIKEYSKSVSKYRNAASTRSILEGRGGNHELSGSGGMKQSNSIASREAEDKPENILDELISFSASRFSRVDRTTSDFMQGLYGKQVSPDYVKCVLLGVTKQAKPLARAILNFPTHYALVLELVTRSISFTPFEAKRALLAIAEELSCTDYYLAYALFEDYVFSALTSVLEHNDELLDMALFCLYGHCSPQHASYVQGLQLIQEAFAEDPERLVVGLAKSFNRITEQVELHQEVFRWILSCATAALGNTSGTVRAAGVLLCRFLVDSNVEHQENLLEHVDQMLDDRDWEVQLQALLFVQRLTEQEGSDLAQLMKKIEVVFATTKAPEKQAYVFVLAFANSLTSDADLARMYVEKLLFLCKDTRWTKDVFSHTEETILPFPSVFNYSFDCVYNTWHFPTLLQLIQEKLVKLERKTAALRLILGVSGGLLFGSEDSNTSNTLECWEQFYANTVSTLFDCVTRVETHSLALGIFESLSMSRYGTTYAKRVIRSPLWIHTLSEVYANSVDPIPDNTTEALCRLMALNKEAAMAGKALIEELEERDQLPPPRHYQLMQKAVCKFA